VPLRLGILNESSSGVDPSLPAPELLETLALLNKMTSRSIARPSVIARDVTIKNNNRRKWQDVSEPSQIRSSASAMP
jgi:hypothetical protein